MKRVFAFLISFIIVFSSVSSAFTINVDAASLINGGTEVLKSSDATLKSLKIDGIQSGNWYLSQLDQPFSPSVTTYNALVSSYWGALSYETNDPNATAVVTPAVRGSVAAAKVEVTAEDGVTKKTYTVNYKEMTESLDSVSNIELKALTGSEWGGTGPEWGSILQGGTATTSKHKSCMMLVRFDISTLAGAPLCSVALSTISSGKSKGTNNLQGYPVYSVYGLADENIDFATATNDGIQSLIGNKLSSISDTTPGDCVNYYHNITGYINSKIAAGSTTATLLLSVDVNTVDGDLWNYINLNTSGNNLQLKYAKSSDATLKSLKIDGIQSGNWYLSQLDQPFSPSVTTYNALVSSYWGELSYETNDPNATAVVTPAVRGSVITAKVEVTAEDGVTKKIYTVNYKEMTESLDSIANIELKALTGSEWGGTGPEWGSILQGGTATTSKHKSCMMLVRFDISTLAGAPLSSVALSTISSGKSKGTNNLQGYPVYSVYGLADENIDFATVTNDGIQSLIGNKLSSISDTTPGDCVNYYHNITGYINSKIAAGSTTATLLLSVDVNIVDGDLWNYINLNTSGNNIQLKYIKSSDATLKSLKIDGIQSGNWYLSQLDQPFSPSVTTYNALVSSYWGALSYETNDPNATVVVTPAVRGSVAAAKVEVTAEDGVTKKTYTVNYKEMTESLDSAANIELKALTGSEWGGTGPEWGSILQGGTATTSKHKSCMMLVRFDISTLAGVPLSNVALSTISSGKSKGTNNLQGYPVYSVYGLTDENIDFATATNAGIQSLIGNKLSSISDTTPGDCVNYYHNITGYINSKIAAGSTTATLLLSVDVNTIDGSLWDYINLNTSGNNIQLKYTIKQSGILQMNDIGLIVEAEDLELHNGFAVIDDANASGGNAVQPTAATKSVDNSSEFPYENTLKLTFNVKKTGNYIVYFRIRSNGGDYTTCWLRGDNRNYQWLNPRISGEYEWRSLVGFRFTEGVHEIEYYYRHFMIIDKIIITNNAGDTPEGLGNELKSFTFENQNNSTVNPLYPLPPVTPSAVHPRLFVTGNDIPRIKANLTHEQNIDVYNKLLKAAENNYDCRLDENNLNNNSNLTYLENIDANAFLYLINKNEAAGRKAITGITNYLSTLNVDAGNVANRYGLGAVFVASIVYDWCYDLFTTEEQEELVNLCLLQASKGEMGWPPVYENAYNSDHGEEYGLLKNLFAFGIAVYNEYPKAYNWSAGRIFSEFIPSRNMRYEDNIFNAQGDNYGIFRSGADWFLRLLLNGLGCDNLITPNQHLNAYQQILRRAPNGSFLQDGDIYDLALSSYISYPSNLFIAANLFKDPYLKNEFYRGYDNGKKLGMSDTYISNSLFLVINDVDVGIKQHNQLPLTTYMGDKSGMLVARTSWDDGIDSNAMIVSMKTPENYFGGHSHLDFGHFYIYYKGPLAIDSGVYESKPMENPETDINKGHLNNYSRQTIAHNSMLIYDPSENTDWGSNKVVNSGSQHFMCKPIVTYEDLVQGSKRGEVLGYDYGEDLNTPSYSYLKGDITGAYGPKVKEYTRSFMFFNFFDDVYPGALIVFDKVTSNNSEFKKTWLLHSQEEPDVNGNVTTIKNTSFGYNGRLINETLLPKKDNFTIEKVGGPGKEFLINDYNYRAVPYNSNYGDESGKWRIELSPKEQKETDYFLNVLQTADNTVNPEPLKSEYYETEDYVGVKIKDRVAFFSKNRDRYSKDVTIRAEGNVDEKLIYAVADLKEGYWDILKDGKVYDTKLSSLEGGVVSFEGTPGEYTLKRNTESSGNLSKNFNLLDHLNPDAKPNIYSNHNGLYQGSIKPVMNNSDLYVPLKSIILFSDNLASIDENNGTFKAELFDSPKRREVELKENSADANIELQYGGLKQVKLEKPIIRINSELYIYYKDLKETFDIMAEYDKIGKILYTTCSFKRFDNSSFIVNVDDPKRAPIKDVTASGFQATTPPYQAVDNDKASSCSIDGRDEWIEFELKNDEIINSVGIIWANRQARQAKFEILVSTDQNEYTKVWEGMSDIIDKSQDFEEFKFEPVRARYVKLKLHGTTTGTWNTIIELAVYRAVMPAPDLIVTDVSWTPESPNIKDGVRFGSTIKNIGLTATPEGVITGIAYSVNDSLVSWSDTYTKEILPGESVALSATGSLSGAAGLWVVPAAGEYNVTAFVDDIDRYSNAGKPEITRENNKGSETLAIIRTLEALDVGTASITLNKGDTYQLNTIAKYSDDTAEDVTGKAKYSSSNEQVAVIDAAGEIIAVKYGIAEITVNYEGKTAVVNVSVPDTSAPEIKTPLKLTIFQTEKLYFSIEAVDIESGIDGIAVKLDGDTAGNPVVKAELELSVGEHKIIVTAIDKAGNIAEKEFILKVAMDIEHLDDLISTGYKRGYIENKGIYISLMATMESINNNKEDKKKTLLSLGVLESKVKALSEKMITKEFADLLIKDVVYLKGKFQ